ncbi:hypothetical protein THOM_1391 [Trachipleistophora hominis]|uniref:Uncharacterized protein n=1 Tax=Trachipleistophora hominis TaxID=72359 RepID=L7JWD6_TRAHO|nr:hypothetical protein THOM_1391 [Trachipleistophora hominis]
MYAERKRKRFQKEEVTFDEASRQAFLNSYKGNKKKKGKSTRESRTNKRRRRMDRRKELLGRMDG